MEQNKFFKEINGNFGFGFMRLPMLNDVDVDLEETTKMVDEYLARGFNYFDTAHNYKDGKCEEALKKTLVDRYPRDSYILTNKLTSQFFNSEEDIYKVFDDQLKACGVDYFDFYLMHSQNKRNYHDKYEKYNAYEIAKKFKDEGKVKHLGISFHDKPEFLEELLIKYPFIEVVQIQFNYLDYEDVAVESKKVYEVCKKYNKPVFVMEPVKGGNLAKLPEKAQTIMNELGSDKSNANYAIRFAAGFENIAVVLSGMSSLEQLKDNTGFMKEFVPLTEEEKNKLAEVAKAFRSIGSIPCTGCRYCITDNHCPKNINVPEIFACYNNQIMFHAWNDGYYYGIVTQGKGKASDCLKCGMCEKACPQHLEIRKYLEDVAKEFEKE